ncbi:MAG: YitT family protein [Oscillospiraceae bacterium]|nr:YitT family protein [Oscillospiraceae bacterium]
MKNVISRLLWVARILTGCAIFALGFDLFLEPNGLNAGGVSGIAMIVHHVTNLGTVGLISAMINLPLFFLGGRKIGGEFFVGSLIGTVGLSVSFDLFALLPPIETEPLVAALYGGILCGAGLGLVFLCNASTGGSDIVVRLLKSKYRNLNIGQISIGLDFVVAALTALVFGDITNMLYILITVFVSGQVVDAVVYKFDYSKVAYIISRDHEAIAKLITEKLERGVTYLYGQGYYSGADTKVILTAVKKGQLAQLKELVVRQDPNAFIIVQEAHQVLGDGFASYSDDSL